MKKPNKGVSAVLAVAIVFGLTFSAGAATNVNLGTASNFAVLGGSTITNTGPTVINGNIGLSPGTSLTGFPPGTISGTQNVANPAAVQAQTDLTAAYNNASGATPVSTIPSELGGKTIVAGAYDSADGTFGITGTLTLNAQNDPNAVFIFKSASTLITGAGSNVVLINGAQACNVFWQVGSSATLGTNSNLKGSVLAMSSVTLTTGANVAGRVLARNGAVTLDANAVAISPCAAVVSPTPTSTPVIVTPTPTSTPVVVSPTPTSTPITVLQPVICTPTTQNALVAQQVNFAASGGNSNYIWSASDLTLINPFGSGFRASYGTSGAHTVTVTSNGQSANCSVNVLSLVVPGLPNTGFAPRGK